MISTHDILRGKILIVDDKEVNVLLLDRMLRGAGYESVAATTEPREVCALHRENRYDAILLDLQMPRMDGFEVMEGLREIEPDGSLSVLVITAQPDQKLRALQAGAKGFVSKPFELAEVLIRVHSLLETRLLKRQALALYERVVTEQGRSEQLLLNVLPHSIAERLKIRRESRGDRSGEIIADRFDEVTVLFADIVGFTKFAQGVSAEVLVEVLNDIFTRFDAIADARGLEKIKTIGDSYMAVAGLPIPVQDPAARAANMALDMLAAMDEFNARRGYGLQVRIGLDTGAAVAGVIGNRKFSYDLWGDVVNTASRMESHGLPGRIQVTDATRRQLSAPFLVEARGRIDVKGKGELQTWFLNGRSWALASATA